MSTSYGWEGVGQVCATLLGARHVYLSPSEVAVSTMERYSKCSTFNFFGVDTDGHECARGTHLSQGGS